MSSKVFMNKFQRVIKVCKSTLMTLILITGLILIILYVIGIKPFVVESGSMEDRIQTGSLCFVNKNAKYESVEVGDIIAFRVEQTGMIVTHRAVSVSNERIVTKGDANVTTDGVLTTKDNYIGKTIFSIPKMGYMVRAIQTKRGKIILGTVIIALLIVSIAVDIRAKETEK